MACKRPRVQIPSAPPPLMADVVLPRGPKLIEVALPLQAINEASVRDINVKMGHPSNLHRWWARRPLPAARAVLWASLVDDPLADPDRFPTEEDRTLERKRLFSILERLLTRENSNNPQVLDEARREIEPSINGGGGKGFRPLLRERNYSTGGPAFGFTIVWRRFKSSSSVNFQGYGRNSAPV